MALNFLHRASRSAKRIAIFPGAWNPPTVAHVSVARAALAWADEVIWLLPRRFPHKNFEGATFEQRQAMLTALAQAEDRFSAAVCDTNLHIDMARETAETLGPGIEVGIICGRDAVERVATWDYGRPGVFEEMLADHPLLVAAREGEYEPPAHLADSILPLQLPRSFDDVSSTEVRRGIGCGGDWETMVPKTLHGLVGNAYRRDTSR